MAYAIYYKTSCCFGGQFMKNIFKGPVRKVVVSKLEVKNGIHRLADYETPIIKEDILFYVSGQVISFYSCDRVVW